MTDRKNNMTINDVNQIIIDDINSYREQRWEILQNGLGNGPEAVEFQKLNAIIDALDELKDIINSVAKIEN